jgi:predicted secreted protein
VRVALAWNRLGELIVLPPATSINPVVGASRRTFGPGRHSFGGGYMALRLFLASLLCASAIAACSATRAADPLGATCDQFQSTQTVEQTREIAAGSDISVALCSNPSTGFAWEEPTLGDSSVVRLVDRSYQAPGDATLPVVGAAGGEVLTFRSVAAGTATVSVRYSQPWVGGTKGEWTYRLSITVR